MVRGVKILPSITDGSGKGRMAATLASKPKRAEHINSIVQLVLTNGYDGIDLDYETFAFTDGSSSWAATRPNWVAFVSELADALHAEGKLLAVTVPPMYDADYDSSSGYWVYDYAAMGKSVDILRIMAYDYSVGSPGRSHPSGGCRRSPPSRPRNYRPARCSWASLFTGATGTWARPANALWGQTINNGNYSMTSGGALASLAKGRRCPDQVTRDAASGELSVSYSIVYRGWTPRGEDRLHGQPTRFLRRCTVRRRPGRVARSTNLGGAALWTIGGESSAQWPAVRKAVGVQRPHRAPARAAVSRSARRKSITRGQKGHLPRRCRWTASPMAVVARRCRRTPSASPAGEMSPPGTSRSRVRSCSATRPRRPVRSGSGLEHRHP